MRGHPIQSMARMVAALAVSSTCGMALPAAAQDSEENTVDVELVLAVDVSWSMDLGEQELQRDGYVAAFRSREVQEAIFGGGWGRVAVTFVEWAGAASQSVVVPWTLIDSPEAAEAFAARLDAQNPTRQRRTSISSAIDFAAGLFEDSPFEGLRRVIDVSGDGPNNQGRGVIEARDAAAASGITINGLPLMTSGGDSYSISWGSIDNLDVYYAECVIGGPGAFMIPVNDWAQFPQAIRRKLVMELAGIPRFEPPLPIVQAQMAEPIDCLVGERMWQRRQERYDFN